MKRVVTIVILVLTVVAAIIFRTQLAAFGQAAYTEVTRQLAGLEDRLGLARGAASPLAGVLVASGTIEAETLSVASPAAGRIAALHVAEGERVAAGALIAEMDTALLNAEIEAARAAKEVAEAQLAQLRAGVREADLDVARAAVRQAEAARDAARVAWEDAQALITAPGELDVAIAQAQGQLAAAEEQLNAANAAATAADLEQALWGRIVKSLEEGFDVPLPVPGGGTVHVKASADQLNNARLQWNAASQRTWEAHAKVAAAAAARDSARQALADLRGRQADPQALRSQADAAEAAYRVAEAAVRTAQAQADVLQAGATPEQIAAAAALVDQADKAIQALLVRRQQARLLAPQAGVVTAVVHRAGEVVAAGSPIVRLADLSQVTLTAYVPEPRLGQVHLGDPVQVAVDSFPDRLFPGTVKHIADRAEFTPRNIQTREERANLVFAVKVALDNPDAALKPGMPADAYFGDAAGPAANGRRASGGNQAALTSYSGTIEATEVTVAAELGGRVVEVRSQEGDRVAAGQVLAVLDSEELAARRLQAEAAAAAARAELARVTAAPQAARVAQAEAQVAQAEAALQGAENAALNAARLRNNPQELDAQINAARGQVRIATAQVDQARAALKAAEVARDSVAPDAGGDQERTRRAMYEQQVLAAQALLRAAEAGVRGSQAALAQLQAIRANPVALDAAVHRAQGQVAQARAGVEVARATLAQVKAPPQPEAVAVARARVAQAEAALKQIDASLAKLAIRSPINGTLTVKNIRPGEVAVPGTPLFTVAELERLKLTVYVPTGEIGQVRLGQPADVTVNAYGGRVFGGTVVHIADQAEFTPKNVQTQEERVKTVFAVQIELENPEGLLKPGMPADAVLRPLTASAPLGR